MAPVKSVCLKAYIKKTDKVRADHFEVKEAEETFELQDGQVLVKSLYFSLDPVLKFSMVNDSAFISKWPIGDPCIGVGVGLVVESKFAGIAPKDIVESRYFPYKTQFVIDGSVLAKVRTFFNYQRVRAEPASARNHRKFSKPQYDNAKFVLLLRQLFIHQWTMGFLRVK